MKYEPICIMCGHPISEDGEKIKMPNTSNGYYDEFEFTQKEVLGLNKKIFGDSINKYYCVKCLAENLGFSVKKIRELVDRWTEIGCELFK